MKLNEMYQLYKKNTLKRNVCAERENDKKGRKRCALRHQLLGFNASENFVVAMWSINPPFEELEWREPFNLVEECHIIEEF